MSPSEGIPTDRPRFPSPAWAEAFREALNSNARYRELAAAWEGDFLLVVAPAPGEPGGGAVHVDLFRGSCRSARFLPDPTGAVSEYTITGRPEDWRRLLSGEIDPVRSIMDRTFRLQGNLLKAMRFTSAAQEMLATATRIGPG